MRGLHVPAELEQPDHPALLYNLACMEARGGRHLDALLHGYTSVRPLTAAESAERAKRILETLRPHVLVTDIAMPGLTGVELAALIRSGHPDTPVEQ